MPALWLTATLGPHPTKRRFRPGAKAFEQAHNTALAGEHGHLSSHIEPICFHQQSPTPTTEFRTNDNEIVSLQSHETLAWLAYSHIRPSKCRATAQGEPIASTCMKTRLCYFRFLLWLLLRHAFYHDFNKSGFFLLLLAWYSCCGSSSCCYDFLTFPYYSLWMQVLASAAWKRLSAPSHGKVV